MENKSAADRSTVLIIAGLVAIIVITLVVLGLFAIQQRPTEVASASNAANPEVVADAAATPASETAIMTDTATAVVTATATAVVTDTTSTVVTDTAAAVVTATTTTLVTDTATAVVTNTAAAVVTATASVSGTNTAVTATVPLTAAAVTPVDMAAVTAAVTKGTCGACHTIAGIDIAVGVIGPNLSTIGAEAAIRIEGYTAEAYLRESILNPNAFIAPKCPTGDCLPNLMLPNLADLLAAEEINTIINYLLTLKGQ